MTFNRFPGTPGCDTHFFVIVSDTAPRRVRVSKPVPILRGDTVSDVRKCSCSLVCRHHEVWVVSIPSDYVFADFNFVTFIIVGDVKHATHKHFVAGYAFFKESFAAPAGGRSLDHKTAFRAERYNDCIFHHLGFHQTQDFCPEILWSVRPA